MCVTDLKVIADRYALESELGRGGMGVVFRAWDQQSQKRVAIKSLDYGKVNPAELSEVKARFEREARMSLQLKHPHIVQVEDYIESDSQGYLVMEFLEGQTLKDYLKGNVRISGKQLFQLLIQICDGLNFAHQQGVTHRDIKPDNLFITQDFQAKIMDFGIARQNNVEHYLLATQPGVMMGTLNYMSPEQLHDTSSVDQRTDIFSLGVVLYEVFTGKAPFAAESMGQTILQIMNEEAVAPSVHNPRIPAPLESMILKALHKRRGERFQSCQDIASILAELNQDESRSVPTDIENTNEDSNTGPLWRRQTIRINPGVDIDSNKTLPALGSLRERLSAESLSLGPQKFQDRQTGLSLECDADGLNAWLIVDPTYALSAPTTGELDALLQRANISVGINTEVLEKAILQGYLERTLIAEGIPAQAGAAAWVEYLVAEPLPGPKSLEDGSVDHRELEKVISVQAGTVLMRRHPAINGEPGLTIFGQDITPEAVSDVKLLEGPGTAIASDDPNLLIATRDGMPVKMNQGVRVENTLELQDVGVQTGNIRFDGSVVVKGSVQKGYDIEAGGDLIIYGTVEGASLKSGSSLYLHAPVYGSSGTVLQARYHIHALFIQQAEIECGGDLVVLDALFHCQARATGKIILGRSVAQSAWQNPQKSQGKGLVNGGQLYSSYLIQLEQAGMPSGAETRLAVGRNPSTEFLLQDLEAKQKKIKHSLQLNIKNMIYQRTQGNQPDRMQEIEKERAQLMFDSNTLTDEINFLKAQLKCSESPQNCQIKVEQKIMTGVSVNLCGSGRLFESETPGPLLLKLQAVNPRQSEVRVIYG